MEIIVEQLGGLALEIAVIVVMAFCSWLGNKVVTAYNRKMAILGASEKNYMVVDTIERIVRAVEQQFSGQAGEDKLAAAQKLVYGYLSKHNVNLSEEEIRALIEAAVYGLKQGAGSATVVQGFIQGGEQA